MAELSELRTKDPWGFLDRVVSRNYGQSHIGFKIFRGHNPEILDRLIIDSSIKKILLLRPNILAVYSSNIAKKEGRRFGRDAGEVQPVVAFNGKKFANFFNQYVTFYRTTLEKIRSAGQSCHVIRSDELNEPSLLANLLSFIGADPSKVDLTSRVRKQNVSAIVSRFSNQDEVEAFLERHGLMGWQYESSVSLEPYRDEVAGQGWNSETESDELDRDDE